MVDSVTGDQGRAAIPPEVLAEALRALGIAPKAPAPKAPGPEEYAHVSACKKTPQQLMENTKKQKKLDGETKARLTGQILQLQSAISSGKITEGQLKEIREIIEREQKTSEREKADETPQAKVDRLWGEIGKLNKEVEDILEPHMTKEEKAKNEEFKRRLATAKNDEERLAIEKEYNQWRKEVSERMAEHGTSPEEREAGNKAKPKIKELEERLIELERQFLVKLQKQAVLGTEELGKMQANWKKERESAVGENDLQRIETQFVKIERELKDSESNTSLTAKPNIAEGLITGLAYAAADRETNKAPTQTPNISNSKDSPLISSPGV